MPKRLTTEQFIERAKLIHGNKYDYSLVEYIRTTTKVKIICPIHGMFEQKPSEHIYDACGCQKCGLETLAKKFTKTTEQFIQECREIYGDKYDYSLVEYKNATTKVKIICPIHGIFIKNPAQFIYRKAGCPFCKIDTTLNIPAEENNFRKRYMELIKRAKENPPLCDFEIHHILPKSLFPKWKNRKNNLIKLSYKDHYLAHYYLYKIYNNDKMAMAFLLMSKTLKDNLPELFEETKRKAYERVSKKIFCFEKNRIFNSASEARKEVGLKGKEDISTICRKKLLNRSAAGFHWCYLEDKEQAINYWKEELNEKNL